MSPDDPTAARAYDIDPADYADAVRDAELAGGATTDEADQAATLAAADLLVTPHERYRLERWDRA